MSKIDSSGMEHGKRGGKVYQEVRGQQIVKNLYKPTNPRSPKQQQHRAKLAFINRLSAHLAKAAITPLKYCQFFKCVGKIIPPS